MQEQVPECFGKGRVPSRKKEKELGEGRKSREPFLRPFRRGSGWDPPPGERWPNVRERRRDEKGVQGRGGNLEKGLEGMIKRST